MVLKTPIEDATKTENDNKYPRYGYDLDYCPEWYLQAWESGELISGKGVVDAIIWSGAYPVPDSMKKEYEYADENATAVS